MDHRTMQAAVAAAAASSGSALPPGMVLDEATKSAMQYFLSQQYGLQQQQQQLQQQQQQVNTSDTFNMTQNALASGIPTLDMPTIMSYLGYGNTFPANGNNNTKEQQTFPAKYVKLMEVIDEIGRDVRPLYAGSKGANDRLRRQINQARHLVRECLMEVDRAQR